MSEEIRIRRAGPADAGRLKAAAVETFEATFRGTCDDGDLERFLAETYTTENFLEELARPFSDYFLIEVGPEDATQTAGFAWLARQPVPPCVTGPGPVELVRFYIRPAWQGRGLGNRLMDHCLAHARQQGYRTMFLGVWEHNTRAQAFYAKYGFRRVGEHVFEVGSDPQIDWWLEASL